MKSMTGFGRDDSKSGAIQFTVEIKSVNHRYFDTRFRLPSNLGQLETVLAEQLRTKFERGSFDITVKSRLGAGAVAAPGSTRFLIDDVAASSLLEGCKALRAKFPELPGPTWELLIGSNRVFLPIEDTESPQALIEAVKASFMTALEQLETMRAKEGAKLLQILNSGVKEIQELVVKLRVHAVDQTKTVREKLVGRIAQWQLTAVDDQRLEQEVAFLADRADVSEELDRLETHAKAFLELAANPKPVGRRLDFLTQELHREANTLGSKSASMSITQLVVSLKTAVEKLREQVQNVE